MLDLPTFINLMFVADVGKSTIRGSYGMHDTCLLYLA